MFITSGRFPYRINYPFYSRFIFWLEISILSISFTFLTNRKENCMRIVMVWNEHQSSSKSDLIETILHITQQCLGRLKERHLNDIDISQYHYSTENSSLQAVYFQLLSLFMRISKNGITLNTLPFLFSLFHEYQDFQSSLLCSWFCFLLNSSYIDDNSPKSNSNSTKSHFFLWRRGLSKSYRKTNDLAQSPRELLGLF